MKLVIFKISYIYSTVVAWKNERMLVSNLKKFISEDKLYFQ